MNEITLDLDERNLAHVLSALALACIADEMEGALPDSRCWWTEEAFNLLLPYDKTALFTEAYNFVKNIRWIAGIGCNQQNNKLKLEASPHHGLFVADDNRSGNPFISYHNQGVSSSIFKTFSGQQSPLTLLGRQKAALKTPNEVPDWLFQPGFGVASWKLDCRVASHAYDLGFGSNEDQSGKRDPFYPAIELLSLAGAAFFGGPHAWLLPADKLAYCIWRQPISLSLASLAATIVPPAPQMRSTSKAKTRKDSVRWKPTSLLDGVDCRFYKLATRGNAYGKGNAYRHFPEATLITHKNIR